MSDLQPSERPCGFMLIRVYTLADGLPQVPQRLLNPLEIAEFSSSTTRLPPIRSTLQVRLTNGKVLKLFDPQSEHEFAHQLDVAMRERLEKDK